MNGRKLLVWLVPLIALLVFVSDQLSKYLVSTNLAIGQAWMPIAALEPFVVVRHIRNSGAAFGMFPAAGNIFLVVAVIVTVGIVRYYFARAHTAPLWVRVSLGLMLGGALGNLLDRIRFGYVVDFVDLGWWPVFNVADSSIVVGVLLLAIYMAFMQPREQRAEPVSAQPPAAGQPLSE
ncbi:MAG: signal peptidase II [Chloroflexota bacterium]